MDYDMARKGVKQAAIFAFISAALTFAMVLSAMVINAKGGLEVWNDPLNFIDVGLLAGFGFAVLRYSRVAALGLFAYFLISFAFAAVGVGPAPYLLGLVFLYFFWKGIRGSFAYHALRRQEDLGYRAAPKWTYYLGIPLGTVLFVIISLGLALELGYLPSIEVVAGEDLSPDDREWLVEAGIVGPEERIEFFYSTGVLSIREDGSLLTDRRVVGYEAWEGELYVSGLAFEEIERIEIVLQGDFLSDTVVAVYGTGGEAFNLWLSAENEGDSDSIKSLERHLAAD